MSTAIDMPHPVATSPPGLHGEYLAVQAAMRRLAEHPDEAEAAFVAFRSLVALGLVGPALEMLESPGPLAKVAELRAIREQLAAMPSGRLTAKTLQTRYQRNLAALEARYPDLRRYDASFRRGVEQYDVYRTRDGLHHLREKATAGPGRWSPPLCDMARLLSGTTLPHAEGSMFCSPYVIVGDQFGGLLGRVYDGTQHMFLGFTPRIYVLEPQPEVFGAMLHALESVDRLVDERVDLLVGPDCVELLMRRLEDHPDRAIPDYVMRPTSGADQCYERCVAGLRDLAARREQAALSTSHRVHEYYGSLPEGHWHRRYAAGAHCSLRILGVTSRFTTVLQHSMRDVKNAFEEQGHQFRLLIEPNDHDLLPPVRVTEAIDQFKPDLLFYIDHLRREYPGVIPPGVPMVCWIQDQLPNLTTADAGRSIGPLDFYIVPAYRDFVQEYGYPIRQGMLWSMTTNPRLYSNEPMPEAELAPHRCDFSYVSNQSEPPRRFHEQFLAKHGSLTGLVPIVERLYVAAEEEVLRQPRTAGGRRAMAVLEEVRQCLHIGELRPDIADKLCRFYYQPLRELMFRQTTLEWVADYCDRVGRTLRLYGHGWNRHPRLAQYFCGTAANGAELRAIYQATRINLQCTTYGAIHQRLLDGLAAGGFFLIRQSPFDTCHEEVRQLLEAVRRHRLAAGQPFDPAAAPEAVEALQRLSHSHASTVTAAEVVLRAADLDHFAAMESTGFRQVAGAVFARYGDVAFADRESFESLAELFLGDDAARQGIADQMRETVLARYTTSAMVTNLLDFIRQRL